MTDAEVLAYVKASAAAQGLVMDDERAQRVAIHMARTAHLAQLLEGASLGHADEPAEIYKPLAFPRTTDARKKL